ncbi:hypothetical protein H2203_002295 [Taxawa tesnikishii (nom. ined.)]|nr:hypothetical protein H2203_002295 [Dothideales sp. JES 119]
MARDQTGITVREGQGDEEANTSARHGTPRYRDDSASEGSDTLMPPESVESIDPALGNTAEQDTWAGRVKRRIPSPVQRVSGAVVRWVKGPQPPRPYKIEPFFPRIQHAPLKLLDAYAPKRTHRFWLLAGFYFLWLLAFAAVLHKSAFASDVPGYGSPVRLSCGATYWGKGNDCGVNGDQCRPFSNSSMAFRCPANCVKEQVLNPHAVGDQEVVYRPLVVGGPTDPSQPISSSIYRGDSFICGSAIHAGFISNRDGGCGVLRLIGEKSDFPSTSAHSIRSVGFDSYFPQSFTFLSGTASQCRDLRWPLLVISVFFTATLSLFTTSPLIFFASVFVGMFFQTGLASDPPSLTDYYSLVSLALGRFLPAAFCAWVIYQTSVRRTLTGVTAQVEKTVLWLGPAWVGALNNYTFDRIPIQRLTPHDIKAQPGAIPALIFIVLAIFVIALGQAWGFRVEGRMPKYLGIYALLGLSLLLLVAVPGMNLRVHHYILALLLLPGTAIQNRPSLVYQGLLVGLFVNGIARWGFDSILQTPGELLGDATMGTLLPAIANPGIGDANITFTLGPLPPPDKKGWTYDGVSVLVNDVERFRGYPDYVDSEDVPEGGAWVDGRRNWTWTRHEEGLPEYFRFAYMSGSTAGDYTKAGTWLGNGSWVQMANGPSKRDVRARREVIGLGEVD